MSAAAVVIGLDTLVGLQTARILHARGIRVIGIAENAGHYCARTRAADRVEQAPTSGSGLVDHLTGLIARLDEPPVLVPCRDPSVLAVSKYRHLLAPARILLPDHDVVRSLLDKESFARVAQSVGLSTPRTWMLRSSDNPLSATGEVTYPAVLKPAIRDEVWEASDRPKGYFVHDAGALVAAFQRSAPLVDRLLLQEWIAGPHSSQYTCNILIGRSGTVLGTFVSQKVRQWPLRVGVGSMGIGVIEREVEEMTASLFRAAGFFGLGYLEVKRDPAGRWIAIEANVGRPTGRSALADVSGVGLLYGMYQAATGVEVADCGVQQPSSRAWVHLRGDVQAGWSQWRTGEATLRQWLSSYRRPLHDAVISLSDPGPMISDLLRTIVKGVGVLLRRPSPKRPTAGRGNAGGDLTRPGPRGGEL